MSRGSTTRRERRARSGAEWVTFAASTAVLAIVIGLIGLDLAGSEAPAEPVAERAGAIEEHQDGFHVPVDVRNEGDEAATDVQVVAELTIDGEATEGDLTVDFLAGGATEEVVFVFPDDPADGQLDVRVSVFGQP